MIGVEFHSDDDALRIAVRDGGVGKPALAMADGDAETGRGLFLVEALSVRWDVFFVADGKVTWAELRLGNSEAAPS